MKIAFITSGAAGMYCGSCMKDNTLVAALCRLSYDAILIPTYTPIRTDEEDVSERRIFLGGINVYLQQKSFFFRKTPWLVDRLFDFPRLLRWVSRFALRTNTEQLGGLTISMLQGTHGKQRKEMEKLVDWLTREFQPDVVVLSNVLISGFVPALRKEWNGPILATLQGDDIFLDGLNQHDREKSVELIRANCAGVDGFFATSNYYADFMAGYLGLPRDRMHVVYPGIRLNGVGKMREVAAQPPYTVGYFARICPEKGLHILTEAFRILRHMPGAPPCRMRIGGWLGSNYRAYLEESLSKLRNEGLREDVEYVDCPTYDDKIRFYQSIDLLSVPTVYREPKGLYVLEALANGVPVVEPRHGAFPELIEATGGGVLVEPNDPNSLAQGLLQLLVNVAIRRQCAEAGQKAVYSRFTAEMMANETANVLSQYHQRKLVGVTTSKGAVLS